MGGMKTMVKAIKIMQRCQLAINSGSILSEDELVAVLDEEYEKKK